MSQWWLAARGAWQLYRAPATAGRWRRVAMVVAAAVTTSVVLFVGGLIHLRAETGLRTSGRSLNFIDPGSPAAAHAPLRIHSGTDTFHGRQWPVLWVEPATSSAPVAPGLDRWPQPGGFAVSPALARAIRGSTALRRRYPTYSILGDDGLADRGEWLAYARPRAGDRLPEEAPVFAGFGLGAGGDESSRRPTATIVLAALVLVCGPAVLVMVSGLSASAPVRDRRAVLMHWIGVPRSQIRRLIACEVVMGLAPGALIGAAGYAMLAMRLDRLPLAGLEPVPGDLVVPPIWLFVVPAALVAIAGWGASVAGSARLTSSLPRPVIERRPRSWQLVPAALAAAVSVWAAGDAGGRGSPYPSVVATALALIGVPLALPVVARAAGRQLARSSSVAAWLAGRRIEADPTGAVRPLLGLAGLVFTVLAVTGYVAATSADDPVIASDPLLEAATVLHFSPQPGHVADLAQAMGIGFVGGWDDERLAVSGRCREIERVIPAACTPGGTLQMAARLRLGHLLGMPPELAREIRLVAPGDPSGPSARALVVARRTEDFESKVEVAAATTLLAPEVSTVANRQPRGSPLWGWIEAGAAMASAVLFVAVVLSAVDRLIQMTATHRSLVDLGASHRVLRRLEVVELALIYSLTVGLAFVMGAVNAWLMVLTAPTASLPLDVLVVVFVVCVAVGAVCCLAAASAIGAPRRV